MTTPTPSEPVELADNSCAGCIYLTTFKARHDEQERYGFGEEGHVCRLPGWEAYVVNLKPTCGRGPTRRASQENSRTLDPSIESLQAEVRRWETDCAFLLSVIDSCDEAEAPSCEMEPEDVSNIARIRQALAAKEQTR